MIQKVQAYDIESARHRSSRSLMMMIIIIIITINANKQSSPSQGRDYLTPFHAQPPEKNRRTAPITNQSTNPRRTNSRPEYEYNEYATFDLNQSQTAVRRLTGTPPNPPPINLQESGEGDDRVHVYSEKLVGCSHTHSRDGIFF